MSRQWLLVAAAFLVTLHTTDANTLCEKASISTGDSDLLDLLSAVKHNKPEVVQSFYDKGKDILIKTTSGDTLLHLAVICESTDVVELLIKLGLSPNVKNDKGASPVWGAVGSGNITMLEMLKANGADIGVREVQGSLLHVASERGNDEMVAWLLDSGLEIDARNNRKETPLHKSAERGHQVVVQMLISRGANVNSRQIDGDSPLHLAAGFGHLAIAQNLIKNGAKVNATSLNGITPLHRASEGGHDMVIEELINNGADCDATRTILGLAPLHMAAFNLNAVKALIRNGADINIPTFNGAKPIHWVGYGTSFDQTDVVQLLLEKGAAVNGVMKNGWTPLHLAALYGSNRIVQKLVDSGADLNAMDANGRTPLHYVTVRNDPELVQFLIDSGADIHVTDKDWETPYSWAKNRGLLSIIEPLRGFTTQMY